jgi:hypothetical protein
MARSTAWPPSSGIALLVWSLCACSGGGDEESARALPGAAIEQACEIAPSSADGGAEASTDVDSLARIGCKADFDALASLPIDVTIPGVRATKFVIDRFDVDATDHPLGRLYFQNSQRYQIHYDFVSSNIRRTFDASNFTRNYYGLDDDREFYLGSVAYYEDADTWTLELAPYDTATADIVEKMFDAITEDHAFFRPALAFRPTSEGQLALVDDLDRRIPVVTTEQIYADVDYQPLTKATSEGVLTFLTAADVSAGAFIPYYSIVVLDEAPNDISVVSGIITEEFQSVLSHVNVLSTNRGTPNMGLRGARSSPTLRQYEGQWVQLVVAADRWEIHPVTAEEGMAYYQAHQPEQVVLPSCPLRATTTEIEDVADIVPSYLTLNDDASTTREDVRAAILDAVCAYGGKTANYAVLAQIPDLPVPHAFGIPIYYYDLFMTENGFYDRIDGFLQDRDITTGETLHFTTDPLVRQERLQDLRNDMMNGHVDEGLQEELRTRFARDYTGPDGTPTQIRFRTSTNSEDLEAFPCAGCYESHTGDPAHWVNVLDAIRKAYTSAWLFRTFEERSYYGVDHASVGMGLLVHAPFPDEIANGVAITANPYDLTQSDAEAFYVNVAYGGDAEVVHLPAGVTTDQLLYYVGASGNNAVYISRTNQAIPDGRTTILTDAQVGDLVRALVLIQDAFRKAYTEDSGWYAMDVEFKFAAQDAWGIATSSPSLWIKQARPYPNPND